MNVPFYPAPDIADYLLRVGTSDLELIYLPQDKLLYSDRTFHDLFHAMDVLVESKWNRTDSLPWDFRAGHRGWLSAEETVNSTPVHVIILHYESLERERRFKDPNVAHEGMESGDSREALYKHKFHDVLASLADYGVQRESIHFRLTFRTPQPVSGVPRRDCRCSLQ